MARPARVAWHSRGAPVRAQGYGASVARLTRRGAACDVLLIGEIDVDGRAPTTIGAIGEGPAPAGRISPGSGAPGRAPPGRRALLDSHPSG